MSKAVAWLTSLATLLVLLDQGAWLSADSWFAGWIGFVLVLVAAGMSWAGK